MTTRGERDRIDDELRHEIAALRAALHEALNGWQGTLEDARHDLIADFGPGYIEADEEQIRALRSLVGPRPGKEVPRG